MPLVSMKKASKAANKTPGKSFAVRVQTMDAELEFPHIDVSDIAFTRFKLRLVNAFIMSEQRAEREVIPTVCR